MNQGEREGGERSSEGGPRPANAGDDASESITKDLPAGAFGPREFRAELLIDAGGVLRPLEECLDDWQREDYEATDRGWLRMLTGRGDGLLRYYLERPKGHDKTTGLAHMCGWALHTGERPLEGVAAASTQSQARRLRDALDKMVRRNPWLAETLRVNNDEIVHRRNGSKLSIITSDAGSNQGWNPDFVIVDELTVWKKRDLWDALVSAAIKKTTCLVVVISNAGYGMGTSWQWQIREYARTHPDEWYFRRLERPCASWMSDDDYRKLEGLVVGTELQRVVYNQWVTQCSETLSADDITQCTVWPGPLARFDPRYEPFVAGLDLAVSGHHAALVIVGIDGRTGKVRLASVQNWKPSDFPDRRIDLTVVHEAVKVARRKFRLFELCVDPWQARLSLQMLAKEAAADPALGMRIKEIHGVNDNHAMAVALVDAFKNRRIEIFYDKDLRQDLLKLSIVEKQHHFAINAPEDPESGHCDRAIALGLTLPTALSLASDLHVHPLEVPPAHGPRRAVPSSAPSPHPAPGERTWF